MLSNIRRSLVGLLEQVHDPRSKSGFKVRLNEESQRRADNAIAGSRQNPYSFILQHKTRLSRHQRYNPHPSLQPYSQFASLIAG